MGHHKYSCSSVRYNEDAWFINEPRRQIGRCCTFVNTDNKDNDNAWYKMGIRCRLNVIRSVRKCMQSSDYIALFAWITSILGFEILPFRLRCNQTCDYWCAGTIEFRTPPRGEVAAVTHKLNDFDSLNNSNKATMCSVRLRFLCLTICSK